MNVSELIPKDNSVPTNMARGLIRGAAAKLYKENKKPTPEAIREMANKSADKLYSLIVQAIDNEFI